MAVGFLLLHGDENYCYIRCFEKRIVTYFRSDSTIVISSIIFIASVRMFELQLSGCVLISTCNSLIASYNKILIKTYLLLFIESRLWRLLILELC